MGNKEIIPLFVDRCSQLQSIRLKVEFIRSKHHISDMKKNDLKRTWFFWIEKLQISRSERISIVLLFALLIILLSSNLFLSTRYQYSQEEYDRIMEEFNRRTELMKAEAEKKAAKYNPDISVSDTQGDPELPQISSDNKVNINTATLEELQSLQGIGEVYARSIISYREESGGFESIEELINVKGIGKKRLDNIRPFIKLE